MKRFPIATVYLHLIVCQRVVGNRSAKRTVCLIASTHYAVVDK